MGNSNRSGRTDCHNDDDNGELLTPIKGLHDNLMRQCHNRDPFQSYEVVTVLGAGSMGSVCKVKKLATAVGGSSRAHLWHIPTLLERIQLLGKLCCGTEEERDRTRDILHLPSMRSSTSPSHHPYGSADNSSTSADSVSTPATKVSSMVTFGHHDTFLALKSISVEKSTISKALLDEMKNEVEILKKLDHPHIVRAMETYDFKQQIYIVMELCSGGDLYTRDPYTEADAARITASILSAVAYMHSMDITHRDLKYENIMFASPKPNADVKIIDFGLSKKYATSDGEMMHDAVGTVYSMSPEVLTGDYTNKVDVWSVGVLAFMLLSSSMPFYGNTRKDVIRKLLKGKFAFKARTWKFVTASAKQFCTELLEYNPDVRPTAEQALHLPWLDTVKHRTRTMSVDFAQHRDWVQVSLESFCQYTILKKLALMVVAHKSTDEEIGFLRRMFHQFDQTNDGDISYSEFASAMEEYGYTENECEALFKGVDLDNSGVVNYSEFVAATIEAHGTLSEERLAEAFDRIDADDSGFITVGDLRELLGGSVPNSYLNQIIDEADGVGEGHDHKIDYSEFLALWGAENDDRRAALLEDVVRRREEQQRKTIGYDDQNLESSVGDDLVSDMSIDTEDEEMSAVGDNMFQSHKEVSIRGHSELYGPRPVRPDVSGMYASRKKVHIIGSPAAIRNEIKYADI